MNDIALYRLQDLCDWSEDANADHLRHIAQRLIDQAAIYQHCAMPRAATLCLGLAGRFEALALTPCEMAEPAKEGETREVPQAANEGHPAKLA